MISLAELNRADRPAFVEALGGIFEQESRTDVTKVPFLGDLPLVGNLFRRSDRRENRTELLLFITPKIIKDSLSLR